LFLLTTRGILVRKTVESDGGSQNPALNEHNSGFLNLGEPSKNKRATSALGQRATFRSPSPPHFTS